MNDLQKAAELERQAQQLRIEAHEKERQSELKKRRDFEKNECIEVYWASDYSGLHVEDLSFYFGYERTQCPTHKSKDDCEDCDQSEWCFVAERGGKEIMVMPQSKVHPKKDEEPMFYLVAGIGHYLKTRITPEAPTP